MFSEKEKIQLAEKLMGTTQIALAKKLGISRNTLAAHTRFHQRDNPKGSFPYGSKTTPRATPETQKQAVDFVSLSPLGKTALGSDAMWNRMKTMIAFEDHSPVMMTEKINRTHDPQWRTAMQLRKYGIEPSSHSSKSWTKYMAFTCDKPVQRPVTVPFQNFKAK